MVNVTIDNDIHSFVLHRDEETGRQNIHVVGSGDFTYDKGPMLYEYGTQEGIVDFAPSLGTNGYALVRGVGVLDLSDGSLVTGTTFNTEKPEIKSTDQFRNSTILTDTGYAITFAQDTQNKYSDDIIYNYYDVTATSPTVQTGRLPATNVGSINHDRIEVMNVIFADSTELGVIVHYRNYDGNNWNHNYYFVDLSTESITEILSHPDSTLPSIPTGKDRYIYGVETPNDEWAIASSEGKGYLVKHTGFPTPGNLDYVKKYDDSFKSPQVFHDGAVLFYKNDNPPRFEVEQVGNTTWANDIASFLNQEGENRVRKRFTDLVNFSKGTNWYYTGDEWFDGYRVFEPNQTPNDIRIRIFENKGRGIAHHKIDGVHAYDDRQLQTLPDLTEIYTTENDGKYKMIAAPNSSFYINGRQINTGRHFETFVNSNDVLRVPNSNGTHVALIKIKQ